MMNLKNPAQNHQKTIDRMRKKMIINKGGQKICLILLVRNQNDNINNLLESVKSIIDMISIIDFKLPNELDNDLIDSIINWGKNNNLPTKINIDQFKNLSYNKTNSIKISKTEFPNTDYFLLSELDFIWNVNNFDKESLFENKYDVIQNIDNYRSTRLLSAKINWVCHLNTYEYWNDVNEKSNDNGSLLTTLSIDKKLNNDKETITLLIKDLSIPNISKYDKSRIKFHLGHVLKNVDMFEEAINYSEERLTEKGCQEEIYCSIHNIGMSYEKWGWKIKQCIEYFNKELKTDDDTKYINKWNKKNLNVNELLTENAKLFQQAISYYKKAYEFRSTRSESLYSAAKLYRLIGINEIYQLAYQTIIIGKKIKCPTDYLFVNKECYDYLFDYELMMICYLIPNKKSEGKEAMVRLSNRNDLPDYIKENIVLKVNYYE
jgi:tetratricopeptide (TPR) repeat protein